jgi:hypothetical protein
MRRRDNETCDFTMHSRLTLEMSCFMLLTEQSGKDHFPVVVQRINYGGICVGIVNGTPNIQKDSDRSSVTIFVRNFVEVVFSRFPRNFQRVYPLESSNFPQII